MLIASQSPTRLSPLLPRVGFDKIVLSCRQLSGPADHTKPPLPLSLDGRWVRTDTTRPNRKDFAYRSRWRYDQRTPAAPSFAILFRPKVIRPRYRIEVMASMGRLLDLRTVHGLTCLLQQRLCASLRVAEVELTFDQEGDREQAEALSRRIHVPRARRREGRENRWWVWGAPRSASSVRVYFKEEDGAQLARLEVIYRRAALRRVGIDTLQDLAAAPWAALCDRKLQLVDFVPSRQSTSGLDRDDVASRVSAAGVSQTLADLTPRLKRCIKRRLRRSDEHQRLIAMLESLSVDLKAVDLSELRGTLRQVNPTEAEREKRGGTREVPSAHAGPPRGCW